MGIYALSNCTGLSTITFSGTQDQWNAIQKGDNKNNNNGNYTIKCSNGDLAKS